MRMNFCFTPSQHIIKGPMCSSAFHSLTACFDQMRQNGRSQVWLRRFTFALEVCGVYFLPFSLRDLSHMASAETATYVLSKYVVLQKSHSEYRVV